MPDHPTSPTRPEVMAALTEHLGPHVAAAVLEALPPYDWDSLATKDDLLALEHRLEDRMDARFAVVDARFDAMEGRMTAAWHAEINRQLRWMVGSLVALLAAAGGIATAVAALS